MRIAAIASAWLAVGCGGTSGGGGEEALPVSCDPVTQRLGTYLMHLERVNGTCGEPPDSLVRLEANGGEGCVLDADDVWSDNGCTLDRAVSCTTAAGTSSFVGVSTQRDQSGSRITGLATITLRDALGTCVGTYRITYTRQ